MIVSPENKIIVKIKSKLVGHYSKIQKVANSVNDSQLNPADLAQTFGQVVSVPRKVSSHVRGYEGFSVKDVRVGDHLFFSSMVVWDFIEVADGPPMHKNEIMLGAREFWKVDVLLAFAAIRDGEIIMLNGYCMLAELTPPSKIVLPASLRRITKVGEAKLAAIGNPLEHKKKITAQIGDTVLFNPNHVQRYRVPDENDPTKMKEIGIVTQSQIFGVLEENLILNP